MKKEIILLQFSKQKYLFFGLTLFIFRVIVIFSKYAKQS